MSILGQLKEKLAKDEEFYGSMDNIDGSIKSKYASNILEYIKELEDKDNQIVW